MMEKAPVNVNIVDGDEFYAHEVTINYTPIQFTVDFKNITPRADPRSKDRPSYVMKHNVVMLDPWHAKQLAEVFTNVISQYEAQYGKVEKPAALAKAETSQNETPQKSHDVPSYFG